MATSSLQPRQPSIPNVEQYVQGLVAEATLNNPTLSDILLAVQQLQHRTVKVQSHIESMPNEARAQHHSLEIGIQSRSNLMETRFDMIDTQFCTVETNFNGR
jgi:hypothetical protein